MNHILKDSPIQSNADATARIEAESVENTSSVASLPIQTPAPNGHRGRGRRSSCACRFIAVALTAMAIVAGSVDSAHAGLLTHAYATAQTFSGVPSWPGFTVIQQGSGHLDTGWVETETIDGTSRYFGLARGVTGGHPGGLLKAYSQGGWGAGWSDARAAWRDVAYLDDPGSVETIRIGFSFSGQFSLVAPGEIAPDVRGDFYVGWVTSNLDVFFDWLDPRNFSPSGQLQATRGVGPGGESMTSNFEDGHFDQNGKLSGTFFVDVPYDPAYGGYAFGLSLIATAYAWPGEITSNALGTLEMTRVTLTDGTPVSVTFDSGMRFSAVPEPASVTLLGLALSGVAASTAMTRRLRKRRRAGVDGPGKEQLR